MSFESNFGSRIRAGSTLAAGLFGSWLLWQSPARAQGVDEFGAYGSFDRRVPPESPQEVAVEARFGPYRPNVDDEFDGATPFNDVFGDDNRYLFGLEIDWQALRIPHVGTLGPGLGIGYTRFSGKGFRQDGTRSREDSRLSIVPYYAVAVFRADVITKETPVPLLPYGKFGLGAAMWWASSADAGSRVDGSPGRGISYGYQGALGLMFLLDVLEPDAAIELDSTMGVNNSYIFAEWYLSNLDGFGSGDQMQMGTNTWFIGLAFEM